MYFKGVRIFGDPSETTEGFYGGDTSTPPTNHGIVQHTWVDDLFAYNTTWDLFQFNSNVKVTAKNLTGYMGGLTRTSGQKNLIQAQNIGHLDLRNSLFWDAGRTFQRATQSAVIEHNIFYAEQEGLWQDLYSDAGYTTHIEPQDTLVYFNSNELYSMVNRTYGITVSEDSTLFIFINNTVDADSITTFIQDSRTTPIFPLYEINTKTASRPSAPMFVSLDSLNTENHGNVSSDYFYYKGYGYRTPDTNYIEPTITSFTPTSADVADSVDIVGDRFTGVDSVFFESTKATGYRLVNDELIRVAVPTGATSGIIIVYTSVSGEVWAGAKYGFTVTITPTFDPFTDVTWVGAFSADEYDDGTDTWTNHGSGNNATSGAPDAPVKATNGSMKSGYGLTFNNVTNTGLQYTSGTVSEPFETWMEFITDASFSGTYRLYANGSATRLTINASGQLSLAGTSDVSTGVTLSTSTYYVLRIVNDGASSSVTVNNGTPATFTITTQNGSSTPKIGSSYTASSGNCDMILGSWFQSNGTLSSGEITNMWTWFGY